MRLIDADKLLKEINDGVWDEQELTVMVGNQPTVATDNNVPDKLKENEVHNYGKIITVYGHDDLDELEKTTIYRDICESLKDAGVLTIHRTETPIGYKLGWKLRGVKKPNG